MINIGIIGAGRMGTLHSESITKLDNAKLIGVYDINPEKSQAHAEKYGTEIFSNVIDLVASPKIDLIIITSPTYAHIEGLIPAMLANKKIFCEKPLCRSENEFKTLAPLIKNYDNFFAFGFVRRYVACTMKMKEMIDSGAIGTPICGEISCMHGRFSRERGDWFADYRLSGGVMLDMLAHHVDLQNYFIGQKPESIYAKALMLDEKFSKPQDYVSATVTYKNGFFANMKCSWLRTGLSGNHIALTGDTGTLVYSDSDGLVHYSKDGRSVIELEEKRPSNILPATEGGMHLNEIAWVVSAAEKNEAPLATADDAIAAMEVSLGMMKSAETGEIVRL